MSDHLARTVVVPVDPTRAQAYRRLTVARIVTIVLLIVVIPIMITTVFAVVIGDFALFFGLIAAAALLVLLGIAGTIVIFAMLSGVRRREEAERQMLYAELANNGYGPVDVARLYTGQPTATTTGHWLRMTRTDEHMTVTVDPVP